MFYWELSSSLIGIRFRHFLDVKRSNDMLDRNKPQTSHYINVRHPSEHVLLSGSHVDSWQVKIIRGRIVIDTTLVFKALASKDVKLVGLLTRQPCPNQGAAGRISELSFRVGQNSQWI